MKLKNAVIEIIHSKTLPTTFFSLQKEKYRRIPSKKKITHIKKCFAYAVSSNRGDPLALKTNLSAIPHHLYGSHSCCDSKWCRYLQNRESFIPKNLPYGKYLSDVNLYKDIVHIFSLYTEQSDTIPPPPPQLVQQPLPSDNNSRVYFDLETNGLGMSMYKIWKCGDFYSKLFY